MRTSTTIQQSDQLHRESVTTASGSIAPKIKPPASAKRRALLSARRLVLQLWRLYYVKVWGMTIHETARFSLKAKFDLTYPKGIHIGAESYIAFGAAILSHDMTRDIHTETHIGARCFIGAQSIILPGVSVGDGSIVGAGSVVVRDVPPGSIVAGNPAKVIKSGVQTYKFGCLKDYFS